MKGLQYLCLLILASDVYTYRKLTRLDRLEICDHSKTYSLHIVKMRVVNPKGENFRISGTGIFVHDIQYDFRLEAAVTRCLNKEALDTCVPFTTMKPINTCSLIGLRNMAWTALVDAIHPPIGCPIKKGEYTLTNGTFDANLFKFFPVGHYYWRVNITFYEQSYYTKFCTDIRVINDIH